VSASDSDGLVDIQQLSVAVTAEPGLVTALPIEPTTFVPDTVQAVAPTITSSPAVEQFKTEESDTETDPDPDPLPQLIVVPEADEPESINSSFPINSLPFEFPIESITVLDETVDTSPVKSEADSNAENRLSKLLRIWKSVFSQSDTSFQDELDRQRFSDELSRRMDDYDERADSEVQNKKLMAQVATGISLTLTAGIVSWVLRAGAMITSLLTSMPAWRQLDLLPILSAHDDKNLTDLTDDADENNEQKPNENSDERVDSLLRKSG